MQFLKRIFLFIFFTGMVYTVFNYLPVIEEEVSSKKIEQTSQDADATEDGDDTQKTQEGVYHINGPSVLVCGSFDASFRRYLQKIYIPPLQELSTPPPRKAV